VKTLNLPSFNWSALEPSSDLKWHECYSSSTQDPAQQILSSPPAPKSKKFSCACLSIPIDYHKTSNFYNVSVPIIKISLLASSSHLGTIITARGRAGNSRIQHFIALFSGSGFFYWIDPDLKYDFVTFDNRGFGYSSPTARCFENVINGALWEARVANLGELMSAHERDEDL
jgi:pimeloyl-ACP methyl ester carboxylesterase